MRVSFIYVYSESYTITALLTFLSFLSPPYPLTLQSFPLAYSTMSSIMERDPGNLHVLSAMGRILLQAGDYTSAVE